MALSYTAEISNFTFAVEAIVSISFFPAVNATSRAMSFFIVIAGFIAVDAPTSSATTTKSKSARTVVIKSAKRSNSNQIVNTLLNGIGAPSASIGVNGDFYIDTVAMNIYGPKKKNAWPLPKSLIGPAGTAGAPGTPGKQGANGKDGRDGTNGKDGERGPTGSSGGGAGSVGATGPTGPAGPAGSPGPAGATGPAGAIGPIGPAGASGSAGPTGAQGVAGTPGIAGSAGAQGIQGETGPRGLQGLQGAQGAQGETGPRGLQGLQGAQGEAGSTGSQGIQGATGATGPSRIIHGNTLGLTLNTTTGGTGITSQSVVTFQANKKYFFSIRQFGAIATAQKTRNFGMEVFTTNVTDLKYSVLVTEAYSYRSGASVHEYIFEAIGTFSTVGSAGDLSFSVIDGGGITGSAPMTLTGNYQLIETNEISRIDQTDPATAIT